MTDFLYPNTMLWNMIIPLHLYGISACRSTRIVGTYQHTQQTPT